jgi:hypothetical protein
MKLVLQYFRKLRILSFGNPGISALPEAGAILEKPSSSTRMRRIVFEFAPLRVCPVLPLF